MSVIKLFPLLRMGVPNVVDSLLPQISIRGFGSIRDAGGKFAEMEKAKEDQYFYNLQKDQLKRLKEETQKKLKHHRDQIEKHEKAIRDLEEKSKDRQG